MNEFPITLDSELCKTLTCLPEKFVVDLANGIDVVRDHSRTLKDQSFLERLKSGLNGENTRRQQSINNSLVDGIEGSLRWLTELTESVAKSNFAIVQVNDRVNKLMYNSAKIANFASDTRQKLVDFQQKINSRFLTLEEETKRIDLMQQGRIHLDQVMHRWQAGKFRCFSLSGRAYVFLEELRWGEFGDLVRESHQQQLIKLIDELTNRMTIQLAEDAKADITARLSSEYWLQGTDDISFKDGIAFLGDYYSARLHPIVYATTQTEQALPLGMPRRCTAERLASAMVREVFGEAA